MSSQQIRKSLRSGSATPNPASTSTNLSISRKPISSITFQDAETPNAYELLEQYRPSIPIPEPSSFEVPLRSEQSVPRKAGRKRRREGHIPRPSNSFILFRANYSKSVEQHKQHGLDFKPQRLSEIAGKLWKSFTWEEKAPWQAMAEQGKAEHKLKYPNYRFRPVHRKAKRQKREEGKKSVSRGMADEHDSSYPESGNKDEGEGSDGELKREIRNLEKTGTYNSTTAQRPRYKRICPFKVGQGDISLPKVPFFSTPSPSPTITHSISKQQRITAGNRRAAIARGLQSQTEAFSKNPGPYPHFNLSPGSQIDAGNAFPDLTMGFNDNEFLPAYSVVMNTNCSTPLPLLSFDNFPWATQQQFQGPSNGSSPFSVTSGPSTPINESFQVPNIYAPQPQHISARETISINSPIAGPSLDREDPHCDDNLWLDPQLRSASYASTTHSES
ncbi:hypothetical protein H0H87_011463 [Tephrocybe sp. NHM501043]|nr:hypothetical protein H0H87_011463 [Tephrocybe sp. NHM501043]